jgi:ketosteroid isomerase-like protein
MRCRSGFTAVFLGCLSASSFGCAAPHPATRDPRTDLVAIDALHRRDERAVLAGNADSLIALWSDDIVSMPAGGPTVRGKDINAQMLRAAIAQQGVHLPLTYELRFEEVKLFGDHAFEWGSYRGSAVVGNDTLVGTGKVMRLLARDSTGDWRIARTMFSADPMPVR